MDSLVCVCVTECLQGVWMGAGGVFCVSMVLTEVDKRSNDCGGSGGSAVSVTSCGQYRAAWLKVSQLLCLSIT